MTRAPGSTVMGGAEGRVTLIGGEGEVGDGMGVLEGLATEGERGVVVVVVVVLPGGGGEVGSRLSGCVDEEKGGYIEFRECMCLVNIVVLRCVDV